MSNQQGSGSGGFPLDNLTYDLVTILYEKSKALEACQKYERDAQGNQQVSQMLQQDQQHVQQLQQFLGQLFTGQGQSGSSYGSSNSDMNGGMSSREVGVPRIWVRVVVRTPTLQVQGSNVRSCKQPGMTRRFYTSSLSCSDRKVRRAHVSAADVVMAASRVARHVRRPPACISTTPAMIKRVPKWAGGQSS